MYLEKFKPMTKVVEKLNQTANGHTVVEILCKDLNISADGLRPAEATKFIGQATHTGVSFLSETPSVMISLPFLLTR